MSWSAFASNANAAPGDDCINGTTGPGCVTAAGLIVGGAALAALGGGIYLATQTKDQFVPTFVNNRRSNGGGGGQPSP